MCRKRTIRRRRIESVRLTQSASNNKMERIDLDLCYKVALEAVAAVSKSVQEAFQSPGEVKIKTKWWDLVTECDRNTELSIIATLSKAFPEHKFLAEETSSSGGLTDDPTWIIDPIDGTTNFVHGEPHFGVSVGLAVGKEVILGVVSTPPLDQTFSALKGKGAFLNGKRIHTSATQELKESVVVQEISIGSVPILTDILIKRYKACVTKVQGIRSYGCAQVSLCKVALGIVDAYQTDFLKPWDVAAGSIIVTEAGGTILDMDGGKFDCEKGRVIAASTAKLAQALVEILN